MWHPGLEGPQSHHVPIELHGLVAKPVMQLVPTIEEAVGVVDTQGISGFSLTAAFPPEFHLLPAPLKADIDEVRGQHMDSGSAQTLSYKLCTGFGISSVISFCRPPLAYVC